MKIGIVTEYYYPTLGGIQEHVHHFARAARRLGHDVRIVTPQVDDVLASVPDARRAAADLRRNDLAEGVIRLGRSVAVLSGGSVARVSSGPRLSARTADILRAERFDVVHLHSPLMPTLPLLFLRGSDALNVGTFHSVVDGSLVYAALRPLLQRYADRLDAAIGVSETALAGVRRYFRAPWSVIPNGVDVALFSSGRRRPELEDGRLNVVHVGRFDPRNGVDRVIRAWVGVRRGGTDARLVLVGDGPLRCAYEAMVPEDLRSDALFVGFVPSADRVDYYASADVLLCPAVGGTFGIILLEAMASGCAIVAADTPGFRHVMEDGVEGFMVDVGRDPDCSILAERTARLLADAMLRRRFGEAGRNRAATFDWSAVTEQVLDLYDRLLSGRPVQAASSSGP
ncbi:MAG TPA: glycosyltransferase family 4 protein [Polyangia bacterium]|nr:glycosyltransferase family 4 protein [Polyangia bacterium]